MASTAWDDTHYPDCTMVWIDGPPESGTLYWLYTQCKDLSDCHPVTIPLPMHYQYYQEKVSEKINKESNFVDISKLREMSMENLKYLERLE